MLILLKHWLFLYINKKKGKVLPIVRGSLGFGVLDTTKPSEGMNNRMQRMRKALPPSISSVPLVTYALEKTLAFIYNVLSPGPSQSMRAILWIPHRYFLPFDWETNKWFPSIDIKYFFDELCTLVLGHL